MVAYRPQANSPYYMSCCRIPRYLRIYAKVQAETTISSWLCSHVWKMASKAKHWRMRRSTDVSAAIYINQAANGICTGASVINLREGVLDHRIHLALAATDTEDRDVRLAKAVSGLERYFFLIAFASYVTSTNLAADLPYSRWLMGRAELRNMVERLRKPAHSAWIFKPVSDLSCESPCFVVVAKCSLRRESVLSQRGPHISLSSTVGPKRTDSQIDESEAIGDEFATQLVRTRRGITLRAGTILKVRRPCMMTDIVDTFREHRKIFGATQSNLIILQRVSAAPSTSAKYRKRTFTHCLSQRTLASSVCCRR